MSIITDNSLVNSLKKDYEVFLKSFNSSKFTELRAGQKLALSEYENNYCTKEDIAIELPTGAGKSLISLLIAETWRQNGYKVAILTANKTLARQMKKEAEELGIPSVIMEGRGVDIPSQDKRAYHRAVKVAIMNYWVYFNQNPVLDPADLLIMDDAHLAEHCLHSLYSVEISKVDHKELFSEVVNELIRKFPEYTVLHDAIDENAPQNTPPELLSFIDQISISSRLKEIVDSSEIIRTDTSLKFRWERIRNSINEANIYLGLTSIWIRPYIYPLNDNNQLQSTKQRLYMSATVGDPGDLCRRLGVRNIDKIIMPAALSEATNGRRLIVMNKIEDSDIPERLQTAILETLKFHPKSIWLCSSEKEAFKMRVVVMEWLNANGFNGHPYWILTNLGDEIERFKESEKGHLFIAGRFDGMDFKGSECRLVILTTLPRAINLQEEFFCAYLRDSEFMSKRMNQRIIQALGRCNREETDYGIYVLADRRFATHFGRDSSRRGIPKNITAEIDIAEDATEDSQDVLIESIDSFISGDFTNFDLKLHDALENAPSFQLNGTNSSSNDEVLGWTALFSSKNYRIAADKFKACYDVAVSKNQVEVGAFFAWCQAKALYLEGITSNPAHKELALEILEHAVVRGGQSSWFNRMRASLYRAMQSASSTVTPSIENCSSIMIQRFDDLLENLGTRGNRFQKWCDKIQNYLESESHNEYQVGLKELGMLLGYNSTIPMHSAAADCQWRGVFGNSMEVVTFEAKIEHEASGFITASAIGQVHNQRQRAIREYEPLGYSIRSCIVTHLSSIDQSAEASAGETRVITKHAILKLWERIKIIITLYKDKWSLDNIDVRKSAVTMIRYQLPKDGWMLRALDSDVRWIDETLLLGEWPFNHLG